MIEIVNDLNKKQVIYFLKEKVRLKKEEITFHINRSNKILIYINNNNEIIGLCTFRIWREVNVDIYTYVLPKERNKGIGSLLFKEITKDLNNIQMISSKVNSNYKQSNNFYIKLNFNEWYTEYILKINLQEKYKVNLDLVKYQDKDFIEYANALRENFYILRKANDFKPYYCLELNENKRKEFLDNKDNIYLLFDNNKIIASVKVNDNYIDDVFVNVNHRRKGIGEELVKFGINKIIDNKKDKAFISVIKWNQKAFDLYTKIGFNIFKKEVYYRKFTNDSNI